VKEPGNRNLYQKKKERNKNSNLDENLLYDLGCGRGRFENLGHIRKELRRDG
jgi:hypothetical protein